MPIRQGLHIGEPRFYLATRPLLPQHDGAARIVAHDVERVLASMPITAIVVLGIWDMACSLSLAPLPSILSLVGQEHGRTIPLADFAVHSLVRALRTAMLTGVLKYDFPTA
jgi:hypothetical protein